MRNVPQLILLGVMQLALVACATVPSTDELQQLDGEELRSALVGNTLTSKTDYGRWSEYVASNDAGYAKASGSWGANTATATYSVNDDGEYCATYEGQHEAHSPEHEYCGYIYTDGEGNYYRERTKHTYEPNKVGEMYKVEIKTGDAYGLGE